MHVLDDSNFLLVAESLYDNPQCCSEKEFLDDVARIKYMKKLITRYIETGELKERLILNHLVVLINVFGPVHLPRMLYLKLENQFQCVKPFLEFLSIMPKYIDNVRDRNRVLSDTIESDPFVVERLRSI